MKEKKKNVFSYFKWKENYLIVNLLGLVVVNDVEFASTVSFCLVRIESKHSF